MDIKFYNLGFIQVTETLKLLISTHGISEIEWCYSALKLVKSSSEDRLIVIAILSTEVINHLYRTSIE